MPDNKYLEVLEKNLSYTLGIQESYVWDFIKLFGDKFPDYDNEGRQRYKAVDKCVRGNPFFGWIIKVTIHENEKQDFFKFLREFCEERPGIALRSDK